MGVSYKDYYKTLGIGRDADADAIRKAYRKLARKYHPDVNKGSDAEARFKEVTEAYEVLSDPEKKRRYDTLGANWRHGQDFRPPPGFEGGRFDFGSGGEGFSFEGMGGFSEFFEALFGGAGPRAGAGGRRRAPGGFHPFGEDAAPAGGALETTLNVDLREAYHGTRKSITLQYGDGRAHARTLDVRIPPGTVDGSRIRLRGAADGHDVVIRVQLAPDPEYRVDGHNLEVDLPLAPWEAALGAEVPVRTLDGKATLRIPPGTQSGQKIRLRGRGLPRREGERGDLHAVVKILVPKTLSGDERELMEKLARSSRFDPRGY